MNLKAINSSVLFFIDSRLPKAIVILGIALTVVLKSFSQGYTPKGSLTSEYYYNHHKNPFL
jgi:hypothetical protein